MPLPVSSRRKGLADLPTSCDASSARGPRAKQTGLQAILLWVQLVPLDCPTCGPSKLSYVTSKVW